MNAQRTILLVEDDDVEVMSVQRALRVMNWPERLLVARDGIEALTMLREESDLTPSGYVILLDINMPRMNGHEFLQELRRDPVHGSASVIILTTSSAESDRQAAGDASVAGYIVKTSLDGGFLGFAKAIDACLASMPPSSLGAMMPSSALTKV